MEDIAGSIRQFFRALLGSRYIERLELDILTLRNDFDQRLHDKDLIIADLRSEKAQLNAEVTMYRARSGMPVVGPVAPKKPTFAGVFDSAPKTAWQIAVDQHDAENARMDREELEKSAKKLEANT